MVKLFKLQVITEMKLNCMKITTAHLKQAVEDGHEYEIIACNKELAQLKYDAMHPQEVLDSVQHLCLSSGNNLIQKFADDKEDKLA